MRLLVQRVKHASVEVDSEIIGKIEAGVLVFLGVRKGDVDADIAWLANKLVNLRMFRDDNGKMNRSLQDVRGEVLIVSQFTLYSDCSQGRRPDFFAAAEPSVAEAMYHQFVEKVRTLLGKVETGRFGALMQVSLVNDGPVTFIIDGKHAV
ncbi:D-aminoacyl-tRNA deacylase [Chlamydiales bacterium SCGC AG-110-P3]|nr:D-aminoacyl-tRNA deacylase [Chlamydiales bacterium SCGC AG-110-P3]